MIFCLFLVLVFLIFWNFQVAKWQYFTNVEIFKNELDQNMELLSGEDKSDILEVCKKIIIIIIIRFNFCFNHFDCR